MSCCGQWKTEGKLAESESNRLESMSILVSKGSEIWCECDNSALDLIESLVSARELLKRLEHLRLTVQTYLLQLMGSIINIYIRISH